MKQILSAAELERSLSRMAYQLAERFEDVAHPCLVGIHTGGVPLARRLSERVGEILGEIPPVGEIDITLYRDDLYTGLEKPILGETRLPFRVTGASVVLVDDVLFTGRTIRAAMDELMDYGRPAQIEVAALIDRGHRELPIYAAYVGRAVATEKGDRVTVRLSETGASEDGAWISIADQAERT